MHLRNGRVRLHRTSKLIIRIFMKPFLLIIALTLLTACGVSLVVPTQADVDRVSGKYPDYSLTELREGKKIYEQHCSMCHKLQEPAAKTAAKWGRIVPEMSAKVNRKSGKEVINLKQQELVLRYLITMGPALKGQ
jgi:cytochrome c5